LLPHIKSNKYHQIITSGIANNVDKAGKDLWNLKLSCSGNTLQDAIDLLVQMINPIELERITAVSLP